MGVSGVLSGLVPLDILYPRGDKGDNCGLPAVAEGWVLRGNERARWTSAVEVGSLRGSGWREFAVLISGACFVSHRGADGNQLSQGTFVISVVTAVVSISRCNEPLPFHLRPPPLLSFAPVIS